MRDPGDSGRLKIGVRNLSDNTLNKTLAGLDSDSRPIDLAWSPDSRTINFVTEKNGKHLLWRQSLDAAKPVFEMDMGTEGIESFEIGPVGSSFATIRGSWIHDAVLITGLR